MNDLDRIKAIRSWVSIFGFLGGAKEDLNWLLDYAERKAKDASIPEVS